MLVRLFVFFLALFSVSNANAGHHSLKNKIVLAADEWCPYTCGENDAKQGILVDVAREAFAKHGIEVVYKVVPWSRAIQNARIGKFDGVLGASKGEVPDFIYPALSQATSHLVFYTPASSSWQYDYEENDSLKKISFGVVADYSYNREIDLYIKRNKNDPSKVQIVYGANAIDMNMKKMLAGRIDALLDDALVINRYLKKNGLEDKVQLAGILPEDLTSYLYIAFTPHDKNAKKYSWILDKETLSMIYSGRLAEIANEYQNY